MSGFRWPCESSQTFQGSGLSTKDEVPRWPCWHASDTLSLSTFAYQARSVKGSGFVTFGLSSRIDRVRVCVRTYVCVWGSAATGFRL